MRRLTIAGLQALILVTLVICVVNSMAGRTDTTSPPYPLRGSDVFLLMLATAALSLSIGELFEAP